MYKTIHVCVWVCIFVGFVWGGWHAWLVIKYIRKYAHLHICIHMYAFKYIYRCQHMHVLIHSVIIFFMCMYRCSVRDRLTCRPGCLYILCIYVCKYVCVWKIVRERVQVRVWECVWEGEGKGLCRVSVSEGVFTCTYMYECMCLDIDVCVVDSVYI